MRFTNQWQPFPPFVEPEISPNIMWAASRWVCVRWSEDRQLFILFWHFPSRLRSVQVLLAEKGENIENVNICETTWEKWKKVVQLS